jgi:CBS domain-containing protein
MLGASRASPAALSLEPTARRVADFVGGPLLTCSLGSAIREAAGRMVEQDRDAVVVLDRDGEPVGIITDSDLRRALAHGPPGSARVEALMSSPVVTLDAEAYFFEAVHAMLRHRLHHLVILDRGRPLGVVSETDLLAARAQGPLHVARRMQQAQDLAALAEVASARETAVRLLHRAGVTPDDLARITAEINDQLVGRVLTLVEAELGPPPLPYCWLGLGSEGRREQALKTDQDNALVYADPPPEGAEAAGRYFAALAERAVAALELGGLPRCKGGVNASNPRWCQPLETWRAYFAGWLQRPEEGALLNGAIFFDLRAVAGDEALAGTLWDDLRVRLPRAQAFIKLLLREALAHRPPLGFRGGFHLEHSGEHRGGFDLKWGGLMPIVEPARVFALARGITETNTLERLRLLRDSGELNGRDAGDLIEAYRFMVELRIRHHLDQLAAGLGLDDYIVPEQLGRVEATTLREHFRVVARLQGFIEAQLQVGLVG